MGEWETTLMVCGDPGATWGEGTAPSTELVLVVYLDMHNISLE